MLRGRRLEAADTPPSSLLPRLLLFSSEAQDPSELLSVPRLIPGVAGPLLLPPVRAAGAVCFLVPGEGSGRRGPGGITLRDTGEGLRALDRDHPVRSLGRAGDGARLSFFFSGTGGGAPPPGPAGSITAPVSSGISQARVYAYVPLPPIALRSGIHDVNPAADASSLPGVAMVLPGVCSHITDADVSAVRIGFIYCWEEGEALEQRTGPEQGGGTSCSSHRLETVQCDGLHVGCT